jgi:hypothetical protein
LKSKMIRIIAAAAVLFLAVGAGFFVTQRADVQISASDALSVCERDGTFDIACITQSIDALPVSDAGLFAAGILDVVRANPELADTCHNIMHTLGRHVSSEIITIADELASVWEPCGYGMLHGVYESQTIPSSVAEAGPVVASLCQMGNIESNSRLTGECYHALGHAIHDTYKTLKASVPVCDAAFPGQTDQDRARRIGCYSGLAMKERDVVLSRIQSGEQVAPTVEAFESIAGACREGDEDFALACAPGFVQVATEFGPTHMPPFLQWCSNVTGVGSSQCYQQAGVYMGHFRANFESLAQSVNLCAPGSDEAVDLCRTSLVEGLMNRGDAVDNAVEEVCVAYQTAGLPASNRLCELARTRYTTR